MKEYPLIMKAALAVKIKREQKMKIVEHRKSGKKRLQEEELKLQEIENKLKEEQELRRRE